jgi:hypothetical protein
MPDDSFFPASDVDTVAMIMGIIVVAMVIAAFWPKRK